MPSPLPSTDLSLESLQSYVDQSRGISERFVAVQIGGLPGVGVLSVPVAGHHQTGWIICHSFGMEQIDLQPLEVALARSLARNGFAALRFHGRGYGESQAPIEAVGLGSHVVDAADACLAMTSVVGLTRIGLIGARFGGAVAALVADQIGASAFALWDPAVSGRAYMTSIVRAGLITELAAQGRSRAAARDPWEVLGKRGLLDVQGFPVTRRAFDEISSLDLSKQLSRFSGDALVVQVSRSPQPSAALARLVARLRDLGASPTLEVVTDPEAPRFGLSRYRPTGQESKEDTQQRLSADLVQRTVAWCSHLSRQEAE